MDLKAKYKTIMDDHFPDKMEIKLGDATLVYKKRVWKFFDEKEGTFVEKGLRYGENPGQEAALYQLVNGNISLGKCKFIEPGNSLVSSLDEDSFLQFGKHPGKINLTDIDSGLNILKFLSKKPAAVIVKHNNPCGVSFGSTIADAYNKANMADRIAAFGGCAVFNRAIDKTTAELIKENYLEVVVAPGYEEGSIDIIKMRKNLRIVEINRIDQLEKYKNFTFIDFKSLIDGGLILQQSQINTINSNNDFTVASCIYKGKDYKIDREPTPDEFEDMLFGWWVEQGVTSNSVIFVKNGTTVGIGTGEQDRVGVAEIAVYKAYTKYADRLAFEKFKMPYKSLELEVKKGLKDKILIQEIDEITQSDKGGLIGSTMISDAFFPFRDGSDVGINQGIRAIVQPGGSDRDFETIEACNEAQPKVTMVFTGQRAFKH